MAARVELLVGSYNRYDHLRHLLACLQLQVYRDFQVTILAETADREPWTHQQIAADFTDPHSETGLRVAVYHVGAFRNDWHHSARAEAASRSEAEWLAFVPDDAYYCPRWLEMMLGYADRHEWALVYCDWIFDGPGYVLYPGQPRVSFIDVGAFLVKRAAFDAVGWPDCGHEGDGRFVETVAARFPHGRCPHVLYVKNVIAWLAVGLTALAAWMGA